MSIPFSPLRLKSAHFNPGFFLVFWFDIFWYSFVYTVVCLFCNIVCGSLIDSNLQNICHIFFKKYNSSTHTRWERDCRLKVNVHVQRVQRGRGLSICTLWMIPIITDFLNFIFDVFQAGNVFYCRAERKICALCLLESKNIKEKATQYNIWIIL